MLTAAGASWNAPPPLDCESSVLVHRRYGRIIRDVEYVLAISGMADVFAKDVVALGEWFHVLARTQGVDAQSRRREHEGHVEVEGRAWVHAFNLGISLAAAVPAMLSPLGGFGRLTTAARMAAACVAELLGWLSSRPAPEEMG